MVKKLYLMGDYIVAEDLKPGETLLKLLPYDTKMTVGGGWKLADEVILPSGKKVDGGEFVEATWWARSSNRLTPPNVTKGSKVTVYRNKKGDQYFWTEETTQLELRKLEEVIFRLSNRPEGQDSPIDQPVELCNYTFVASTLNQVISFKSSKNNNEPVAVTLNLDLKRALFFMTDTAGNKHIFDMEKGNKDVILINSNNVDVPEETKLIGKSETMYNMGGSMSLTDGDAIVEISGGKAEKIKELEQDIVNMKQHIGTLVTLCKDMTIAMENHLAINAIKIGKVEAENKPIAVDIFNEAKDKILEHFQQLIDSDHPRTQGEDEEEKEKREKVESEKHEDINIGTTLLEVDVEEPIKFKGKAEFDIQMQSDITMKSQTNIAIEATSGFEIKGAQGSVSSQSPLELKGPAATVGAILTDLAQALTKAAADPITGMGAPLASPNLIAGAAKLLADTKTNLK